MAIPGDMGGLQAPHHEWAGQASKKFADQITANPLCRRIVETNCRNGAEHSVTRAGFARFFTDSGGLVPSEGKRILGYPNSEVYAWRPARRALSEPGAHHYEKPEGKRTVEPSSGKVFSMREKRHIRQAASKEEYHDRSYGPKTTVRDNGLRAADQPAREVDISMEMCRKVRPLDLCSQRNEIGCRSLGDKSYRHPEYENKFFNAGGLIVGSTFNRGHFKKTEARNSTNVELALDSSERRTVKSYEEKQREQEAREAQSEVEDLTRQWEAGTLKECDTAYKEPVDSDDEAPAGSP